MRAQLWYLRGPVAASTSWLGGGVHLDSLFAHGGLFKSYQASPSNSRRLLQHSVSVGDTAGEAARGITVLAHYRRSRGDEAIALPIPFERVFAGASVSTLSHPEGVAEVRAFPRRLPCGPAGRGGHRGPGNEAGPLTGVGRTLRRRMFTQKCRT